MKENGTSKTEQRLIDANARIEEIRKAYCTTCDNYDGVRCRYCWVDDGIGLIEDAPTLDAVEVVRCKNCEFWNEFRLVGVINGKCRLGKTMITEPDHYCSYGKRRSE